jgi:single-strand DNA-binding protein
MLLSFTGTELSFRDNEEMVALMMAGRPPVETFSRVSAKAKIIFKEYLMNNLNSILIEGNLVRDPKFTTTPKGTPLCTFPIASVRYFKGSGDKLEKEVSFFDIETWAKLAQHCENLGHKGRSVRVVGRLRQDRWNGSDGKSHARIVIIAEHVEFRPEFSNTDGKEEINLNIKDYEDVYNEMLESQ